MSIWYMAAIYRMYNVSAPPLAKDNKMYSDGCTSGHKGAATIQPIQKETQ